MFTQMRFGADRMGKMPIAGALLRSLQEGGELSIPAMRALSPLSDKAQVMVDRAVVEVGLERLQFAADLMAAGLVYNLPDPLSVTQLEWDQESKVGGAVRVMSPSSRGENQLPDRKHNRLPIYLTMEGFSLDIRTLKMSERVGQPLDTSLIKSSTRRVNEAIEDAAINGATTADGQVLTVAGFTAPGLLTAPSLNSANTTTDWSLTGTIGTDGPARVNDILAGISALQAAKKFGPYNVYIGTKAGNAINQDFKVNTLDSIRARLEMIDAGGSKITIRVADRMPDPTVSGNAQFVIVQMTDDVVQMVNGQPPTVIPWTSLDGFTLHWVVLAIMVQRIRADYDGNSGVYIGRKT